MSTDTEPRADIGLVGLAVMGQNLVLNMADQGYVVGVYNRTTSVTKEFVGGPAADASVIGCDTLESLVQSLRSPRRVMVTARIPT
jgi:6-phosphogluconate dehydrogenase